MNIIIPLAGLGERFKKSFDVPKPLINVFGKPIISHVLDNLFINNDDIIFILYHIDLDNFNFSKYINDNYPNIKLIKIFDRTKGAAHTLNIGLTDIINNFKFHNKSLIIDCDTFYTTNIIHKYRNINYNAIFYTINTDIDPIYSYITIDNNFVSSIREKNKISDFANTGAYCFNDIHKLFKYSKYVSDNNILFNNECYISCIIHEMIKDNEIFSPIQLKSKYVFNLGTPHLLNLFINNTYCFLFDLDGTLVITDDIYFNAWKTILNNFNIHLDYQLFNKYIHGNNDQNVLNSLLNNSNLNVNDISTLKDKLFIQNINDIKIINSSTKFIKKLYKNGHRIAIVTNCNRHVAQSIINSLSINKYIHLLVIGSECIKPKPYPDPYIKAIQFFNTNNNKCIIFEDSKTGLLSARMSNPKCIVGIPTYFDHDKLIKIGADIVIDDFSNINIHNIISFQNNKDSLLTDFILKSIKNSSNLNINSLKLKGGYISDVIQINLLIDNSPTYCVCKLENKNDSKLSLMANKLGLYEREYYFYENISNYINISIPKFYGLIKDNELNNIGILLQDLTKLDYTLNLDLNTASIDISLNVIHSLAKMHSKFWNKKLDKIFPLLKKNNDPLFYPVWQNFILSNLDTFINKWQNIIGHSNINKFKIIANNFHKIQNHLSSNNLTLCHGDVKSPNIFYKIIHNHSAEPFFIDWQYISHAKGTQDLVFFMIESFNSHIINHRFQLFIDYYFNKLIEFGISSYSYNEFLNDIYFSITHFPFFVAIWFGTTPNDDLIDQNFPFFFINKFTHFINSFIPNSFFDSINSSI